MAGPRWAPAAQPSVVDRTDHNMDDALQRIEFDATLDDMVDTSLRFTRATKTGSRLRWRDSVTTGLSFAVAFLFGLLLKAKTVTAGYAAAAGAVSVLFGFIFAFLWRFICDRSVR